MALPIDSLGQDYYTSNDFGYSEPISLPPPEIEAFPSPYEDGQGDIYGNMTAEDFARQSRTSPVTYFDWSSLWTSPWQTSMPPSPNTTPWMTPPIIPQPAPKPAVIPTVLPPKQYYAPMAAGIDMKTIAIIGAAAVALYFILKRK